MSVFVLSYNDILFKSKVEKTLCKKPSIAPRKAGIYSIGKPERKDCETWIGSGKQKRI